MRLKNRTDCLAAEVFIRGRAQAFRTAGLTAWLKYARAREPAVVRGAFNRQENRIVALVPARPALPVRLRYPVATQTFSNGQFQWVFDEETAESVDELLVWVFFHEFRHFLCHTRQAVGDWQTKANAFGFEFLRTFKATVGAGAAPLDETVEVTR